MKAFLIFGIIALSCSFSNDKRTTTSDSLVGTWKGTSVCQVKNSPCHDEISVCHISQTKQKDVYQFVMNKVVAGKEEDMGIINFTYNAADKTLTGHFRAADTWKFTVNGNTMDGTLVINDSTLYRIIHLEKQKSSL
jgi:hypothetical protein